MYAIVSLIKKKKKIIDGQSMISRKGKKIEKEIKYLLQMRIFETESLKDSSYVKNCLSSSDQMKNRGGLSYISENYYQFARTLMKQIRICTSKKMLMERRNKFISLGKRDIATNDELKIMILNVGDSTDMSKCEKLNLYKEIWTKIFHARAGVTTSAYNDENDIRHCKDGFGGESFRTTLKAQSLKTTTEKVQQLKENMNKES